MPLVRKRAPVAEFIYPGNAVPEQTATTRKFMRPLKGAARERACRAWRSPAGATSAGVPRPAAEFGEDPGRLPPNLGYAERCATSPRSSRQRRAIALMVGKGSG